MSVFSREDITQHLVENIPSIENIKTFKMKQEIKRLNSCTAIIWVAKTPSFSPFHGSCCFTALNARFHNNSC